MAKKKVAKKKAAEEMPFDEVTYPDTPWGHKQREKASRASTTEVAEGGEATE